MATNQRKIVTFRRRRENRTSYKKRLKMLISRKPRLVIRKTLKNIIAQIVEYDPKGDKIIASASSKELEKSGWKLSRSNIPASYLTGMIIAKKAKTKNIGEVIVDLSFSHKSKRIYALVKGAIDNGMNINASEEVFPDEDTLKGKKIADYAEKLKKEDAEKYKKQFSGCLKANLNPEDFVKEFEQMKNKLKE